MWAPLLASAGYRVIGAVLARLWHDAPSLSSETFRNASNAGGSPRTSLLMDALKIEKAIGRFDWARGLPMSSLCSGRALAKRSSR